MQKFDIIIVGGGIVGLTLARALSLKTSLSIAIIDHQTLQPVYNSEKYQPRVSAITLASKRIFENLQTWQTIASRRISPFEEIKIWDDTSHSMQFDARNIAEPLLGYIIENNLIISALLEKLQQSINVKIISPLKLKEIITSADSIQLIDVDNEIYEAKLAVAADGANSWLRKQVGIDVVDQDYQQTAIVASVTTALPHQKIARQVFLKTGPLAFLPLKPDDLSSIVWSLPTEQAAHLQQVSIEAFQTELHQSFPFLGEIKHVSERFAFPLHQQYAKKYFAHHVVLAGDAAHIVHPLAGQGVNMGLLDAASLFDVIYEAVMNKRNFAHYAVLRKYERWRRADNLLMFNGIKTIKSLFSAQNTVVKNIRTMGMKLTDRTGFIKNIFTKFAVGDRSSLPTLSKFNMDHPE